MNDRDEKDNSMRCETLRDAMRLLRRIQAENYSAATRCARA